MKFRGREASQRTYSDLSRPQESSWTGESQWGSSRRCDDARRGRFAIDTLLALLRATIVNTAVQLVGVLGVFLVFGAALHLLERWTTRLFTRTWGWRGVLVTAWLGTPVHELGHALACVVFRHEITELELFRPDPASGTLGHVSHRWNTSSLYQNIGNLFIGIAPLLAGSLALYVLLRLLVPNGVDVLAEVTSRAWQLGRGAPVLSQLAAAGEAGLGALTRLLTPANLRAWQFWVFLYAALCIASHIAPSPSDLRSVGKGLAVLVALLLIANATAAVLGADLTSHVLGTTRYLGWLVALFMLAVVLSTLNFVATYIVLSLFRLVSGRGLLSPVG